MNYRTLGSSDIETSEIGLGTWSFASRAYGDVDGSDANEVVRFALDQGITLFDTAPLYGNRKEDGISERILGKALGSDRDRVLISSKFGRRSSLSGTDFSGAGVRASVEASLVRLETDRIDVLFFHSPFGGEEIQDDVWEGLDHLKAEGMVRLVGHSISKFQDTQQMARDWARDRKIDAIQVVSSLMNRESAQLIHDLGRAGLGVVARETLANGFLSGRITRETTFPKNNLNSRYQTDEIAERVDFVEALSFLIRDDIHSMPAAAYRWILDNGNVSTVLSGAKNMTELSDVLAATDASPFTAEERGRADAIHTRDFDAA